MPCPFCAIDNYVFENEHAFTIYDKYPVNQGHTLIIPKRHVADFFDLTDEERQAIDQLLFQSKEHLQDELSPDGFNMGVNCGETAGQTIFHVHVHLIPRFKGDLDDPRGGVRGVIPEKKIY